jgi:SAM-dependent methyltransferase
MKRYRAIPEYYDAENVSHEMLDRDVPFFLKHLRGRQSTLELAVGTARAAIPIAQAGHQVVGIDNDARMLKIARRKRDAVGLGDREVKLVHGDVLKFDLRRRFDWVCIFFNTFLAFTTLQEQDQLLQAVLRHLKPRGRFWLDIFQPNLAILAQDVSVDLAPVAFYVPELDRTVCKTIEVRRDPTRQMQRVTFHYTFFDVKGLEHRQRREFDLTFVFPRELQLLLERNGLRIERMYGDHDGSRLNADSPRMIACCSRA